MHSSTFRHSFSFLLFAVMLLAGTAARAQTLLIVGGNGQLVANASIAAQPLTVQLLDASGQPAPDQLVTFADTLGGTNGAVNGSALPTDANGITSIQFRGPNLAQLAGTLGYVQTNIIASYGTASVSFIETTTATNANGGGPLVQATVVSLIPGQQISGAAGSPGTTPILVQVTSFVSGPVPNVAVSIASDTANSTGTLSCKEGPQVFTDIAGNATCTPLFGKLGTGTFTVNVGGLYTFGVYSFVVTVGPPGLITITSGNNQSGTPGQRLALPIVAVVSDVAGNIISGAQVVFESVTPGAVTFLSSVTTSDANGRVSTSVVLGNTPGPVQIRIRDAGNLVMTPAIATVTVNITVSGLAIVSGNGQTAFLNAIFPLPLVVRVTDPANNPVAGASVTFTVVSGLATLSPTTILTASDGTASTSVMAGGTPGPVTIRATTGSLQQTFSLTINPPGPINFSYLNGASFAPNQISPGSIVTINAQGLVSANVQGVVGGTLVGILPYTVAGVSVTVGNLPAPIFYVGNINGQQSVTIQVPFEVPAGTVPITIAVGGGGSTSAFVTLLPVAPGVFETLGTDNRRRVVALRPNGTVVTQTNPAGRGENIRVYMTGLGPVSPAVPTGTFPPAGVDPMVTSNLVAGINNNGVNIVQAVYARNLIGVYELTVTVPTDTVAFPSGTVNFSVAVQNPNGAYIYSNSSLIPIQ